MTATPMHPLAVLRDELTVLLGLMDTDPDLAAAKAGPLVDAAKAALRAARVDSVLLASGPPWLLTAEQLAERMGGIKDRKVYEMRAEARKAGRVQDPQERP